MKKYLFMTMATLFLFVATVRAQSFEFQFGGKSLADGETVTISAAADEFGFGELWCETNPSGNPNNGLILKLLSESSTNGSATLDIEHNDINPNTLKWCMGGECTMMTDVVNKTKQFDASSGMVQVQFDAEGINGEGYLLATLTVTFGGETHSVKIKFVNGESAENQMWWGYMNEKNISNSNSGLGSSQTGTLDVAIFVPAAHNFVDGSTIKAIRFWLGDDLSKLSGDVKVWLSQVKPRNLSDATYLQTIPLSELKVGKNEIELETPYIVKDENLYIGYTCSFNERAFPVMFEETTSNNSLFYRHSNSNEWEDLSEDYGKLALQLLIEKDVFPEDCASVNDYGQIIVMKGESVPVPIAITNTGKNNIESISYTITTEGGNTTDERTTILPSLALNEKTYLGIFFESETETKKYGKTVTITKVNGVENMSANKKAQGTLITIAEKPAVVPVVEEFTGTWCGYCPYGMVGMQAVHEVYGDNVVLIAAHSGDIMTIKDYQPVISTFADGYPSSIINRTTSAYPQKSTLLYSVKQKQDITTQGSIELKAEWNDEKKENINFIATSQFVYDDDSGDYGIAFVIVEDGLTGTGSSWAQSNNLSGETVYENDEMEFWKNAGSKVTDLTYDHVAVAAWSIKNGVNGSVNSTIQANIPQTYNFKGELSKESLDLIQDKSKLTAIALLIDRTSGTIVNAAQAPISEMSTDITDLITNPTTIAGFYTIDGKRISTPVKGVNIVKYVDGSTKKIFVK